MEDMVIFLQAEVVVNGLMKVASAHNTENICCTIRNREMVD